MEKPSGWIAMGVFCLAVSLPTLWVALDAFREADERGMVIVESRSTRRGEYPAHFFLSCPVSFGIGAGICFYMAWKVAQE